METYEKIEEKSDFVIIRNTRENDLDFVVDSEGKPDNIQYVGQWTKEQHRNALFQEDILHLIVYSSWSTNFVYLSAK